MSGDHHVVKRFPFSEREIILASSSPRRRYLLRLIRIKHTVASPRVREEDHGDSDPVRHVLDLSRLKARSVRGEFTRGYILGADTIVVLNDRVFGKPAGAADARRILHTLAGTTHQVITGLTLLDCATGRRIITHDVTGVTMRALDGRELDAYIASDAWVGKAGAYGVQDRADAFITRLDGSYSNVVGLPLERLEDTIAALCAR